MKIITTFTALLLLTLGLNAQDQDHKSEMLEENRIYWSEQVKLSWNDFRGEIEEDENVAALSSIALPYNLSSDGEGELIVQMRVCFIRNESWSKPEQQNKVLLQHEQVHFDIAELHRRKVIKALQEVEMDKNNYRETIQNIMGRVWKKQYREMQDQYDKETNYSRVFKAQISWNKFLEEQLKKYQAYSDLELKISLIN